MDGRTKRTQRITERIKETALILFSKYGTEKVSMDEVAAQAEVSKVTIYKYFHSKEDLHRAVVDLYVDQVFAATEALINSDLDYLEKLKLMLTAKTSTLARESSRYFIDLLEHDKAAEGKLNQRIKAVIFTFFEEGKRLGYIAEDLPFELLYLHSEIYQAGFAAKLSEAEAVMGDPAALEKMLDLYFWGILKKR